MAEDEVVTASQQAKTKEQTIKTIKTRSMTKIEEDSALALVNVASSKVAASSFSTTYVGIEVQKTIKTILVQPKCSANEKDREENTTKIDKKKVRFISD